MDKEFLVEKERVARSFLRGMATYDRAALVQGQVNERLMSLLLGKGRINYRRILEIGCCTGMLTEMLADRFNPEQLYINDLVAEFYQPVLKRLPESARSYLRPLFGDIETCAFPENLDLVVSSSAFQWLSDLETFFRSVSAALGKDGILAFSMFGEGTFGELTELTGAGLRYHCFNTVRDLVSEFFPIIYCGVDKDRLFFNDPRKVLHHIKNTGVGGAGGYTWTPRKIERFVEQYRSRFATRDGIPVSYVSYTFIAGQE